MKMLLLVFHRYKRLSVWRARAFGPAVKTDLVYIFFVLVIRHLAARSNVLTDPEACLGDSYPAVIFLSWFKNWKM